MKKMFVIFFIVLIGCGGCFLAYQHRQRSALLRMDEIFCTNTMASLERCGSPVTIDPATNIINGGTWSSCTSGWYACYSKSPSSSVLAEALPSPKSNPANP